jgi:4-hydroxy-2-oxoheptanedioate aldolase
MAHMGFDWLVVDTEHAAIGIETAERMLQAISTTEVVPIVRVAWNDIAMIKWALDSGAYGVVVPFVSTREEAERTVSYCKYPPQGIRGVGGVRRGLYGGDSYFEQANDEILVIVQTETVEAVQNIDEILAVPGIDVFFVGPNDLSVSLGQPPSADNRDPEFVAVLQELLEAGRRHGVAGGIWCGSPEVARERIEMGFRFVDISSDLRFMARGAKAGLDTAKSGYLAGG